MAQRRTHQDFPDPRWIAVDKVRQEMAEAAAGDTENQLLAFALRLGEALNMPQDLDPEYLDTAGAGAGQAAIPPAGASAGSSRARKGDNDDLAGDTAGGKPVAPGREHLDLADLREQNTARAERWHGEDSEPWSLADWSNAMCGEAGEAANVVKKIRRRQTSVGSAYNTPELDELYEGLALELADLVIYADLVAAFAAINLAAAVRRKFNQVSEAQGFPERIEPVGEGANDEWCDGSGHYLPGGREPFPETVDCPGCPACLPALQAIPTDFWRAAPCGHPSDPVAMRNLEGWPVCHCGYVLSESGALPAPPGEAPGRSIAHCPKCGCHVAIPPTENPHQDSGGEGCDGTCGGVVLDNGYCDGCGRRAAPSDSQGEQGAVSPERRKLLEFDAWLSMRGEHSEILRAFRDAAGTDTSAKALADPHSEVSRANQQGRDSR